MNPDISCCSLSVGDCGYHAAILCKRDQVEVPISSRVGGHAVYVDCLVLFLDATRASPTRCNAADKADFVSSQAGLSQSPPPIDFSNEPSWSAFFADFFSEALVESSIAMVSLCRCALLWSLVDH